MSRPTQTSMTNFDQQSPATSGTSGAPQPANLGDILERALDKGVVIAGDIQINLLDIELLTIKLRLVVASLDTAREVGIDWWLHDPWLHAGAERPKVQGDSERQALEGDAERPAVRGEAERAGEAEPAEEAEPVGEAERGDA